MTDPDAAEPSPNDEPLPILVGDVPLVFGTRPSNMPPGKTSHNLIGWQTQTGRMEAKQVAILDLIRGGMSLAEARRTIGVHEQTVKRWRKVTPQFVIELTKARREAEEKGLLKTKYRTATDLRTTDFVSFRKNFFHHPTATHHLLMIETIERSKPGELALILAWPGSGKSTVLADYINYKLALDPNQRFALISEGQDLARRILGQIANRFTDERSFLNFIATYGPFRTPKGEGESKYVGKETGSRWTANDLTVHKATHDEKEPSVLSLGWGSAIYGGRFDRMIYDDLQSTKNLSMTDKMMTWLRQDALTRPGHTDGGHVFIGSRVGQGDIYSTMMQEQMIANMVKIPAMTKWVDKDEHFIVKNGRVHVNPQCSAKPTWDAWTLRTLAQRRHLVKEEIWTRTYMLEDFTSVDAAFTEDMLNAAKDQSLNLGDSYGDMTIASVDPALGKGICAFMVAGTDSEQFKIRDMYVKTGFNTYEDIYEHIALLSARYRPEVWVIENNAFQQGITSDPRLLAISAKFGFKIQSHATARNKNDPMYGVAMMASAFADHEVRIPWGNTDSIETFGPLIDELRYWRPGKRGGELVQDRVVALWFAWKYWNEVRQVRWASRGHLRRDTPTWMRGGGRGVA